MDKNEILEKSRLENENGDEREQQMLLKAAKNSCGISQLTGLLFCGIILFIEIALTEHTPYEVLFIYWGMIGVGNIVDFIHLRKKWQLFSGIIDLLIAISSLALYIRNLIG